MVVVHAALQQVLSRPITLKSAARFARLLFICSKNYTVLHSSGRCTSTVCAEHVGPAR